MKMTLERGILSDNLFHQGTDSLYEFLDYCNNFSGDEMNVYLEKEGNSFLLRVACDGLEEGFEKERIGDTLLNQNELFHPYLILLSELCRVGHIGFVQDRSLDRECGGYHVCLTPLVETTEIKYLDSLRGSDCNLEYGVSFSDDVSQVWGSIRRFSDDTDIDYYIRDLTENEKAGFRKVV